MILRYLSLFSGIEAATVAWEPLGWTPAAFAEIEKFPAAVLAHHYPHVPNLGDVTQISGKDFRGKIDLLVGGPPCQAFSQAGLRKGLDDPRGQVTFVFLKVLREARPRWFIVEVENVPGLLSIDGGRTLGAIFGEMAKCGYGFAYRVLNARHWGIPQSRRRLYIVGHLGDWRPAAAVLFERQSLSGNTSTRRSQRPKSAGTVAAGPGGSRRQNTGQTVIGDPETPYGRVAPPFGLSVKSHPVYAVRTAQTSSNGWGIREGTAYTLDQAQGQCVTAANTKRECSDVAPTLCAGPPFSRTGNSRVECEALVTQALTARLGDGGPDDNKAQGNFYLPVVRAFGGNNSSGPIEVSPTLNAHGGGSRRMDFDSEAFVAHTLRGEGFDAGEDGTGKANLIPINLQVATRHQALGERTGLGIGRDGDPSFTLSKSHVHGVFIGPGSNAPLPSPDDAGYELFLKSLAVRRLTVTECERLQGFPDYYTLIPWRGKPAADCPDGPRYKALGNSMPVPVMRWIGERIVWVESIMAEQSGPEFRPAA